MSAALQLPPTPEDFERVELVLRSLKAIKAATPTTSCSSPSEASRHRLNNTPQIAGLVQGWR